MKVMIETERMLVKFINKSKNILKKSKIIWMKTNQIQIENEKKKKNK